MEANKGMMLDDLMATFPFATFSEKFSRVREFEKFSDDFNKWTFLTYVKRAEKIFGPSANKMRHQISGFQDFVRVRVKMAFENALKL